LVFLQSDALFPALARLPVSPQLDAVAGLLGAVAVLPDVAAGPASAHSVCALEQADAPALQLASGRLRV
jgi:hypothetical protein